MEVSSGPSTFVVSNAGHVASVITHPRHNKYGYWEKGCEVDPDVWLRTAEYKAGSWWPRWGQWLKARTVITNPLMHNTQLPL